MHNNTTNIDPGQGPQQVTETASSQPKAAVNMYFSMYIGIGIGVGITVCAIIVLVLLRYSRRKFRNRSWSRTSARNLFVRGFSTVSQRGAIDSTAEFEMVNSPAASTSSYDNNDTKHILGHIKNGGAPKKPERRRTRNSSSNVKYENVTLDPTTGHVMRKSVSMQSDIPFIDSLGRTSAKQAEDTEDDEVFE